MCLNPLTLRYSPPKTIKEMIDVIKKSPTEPIEGIEILVTSPSTLVKMSCVELRLKKLISRRDTAKKIDIQA